MSEPVREYRVCWSASSNIGFRGESDRFSTEGTAEEIEEALTKSSGALPDGLDVALEASGFEWWVETR